MTDHAIDIIANQLGRGLNQTANDLGGVVNQLSMGLGRAISEIAGAFGQLTSKTGSPRVSRISDTPRIVDKAIRDEGKQGGEPSREAFLGNNLPEGEVGGLA